jgi:membrane protein required for colicin V production
MGFSILDWLILLVIVLNVAGAIAEGFVYELFSLAGVIAGYLIAAWEYPRVAAFYLHYVSSAWAADIAGFLTVFFVVVLLGGVAGKIGRSFVEGIG